MDEYSNENLIFTVGYAQILPGYKNETDTEAVRFYEKESKGGVGASNLYVLANSTLDTQRSGQTARYAVKKVIYEYFRNADFSDANKLALSMRLANNDIFEYSKVIEEPMRASLIALSVTEGKIVIGSIGVNCAYIIRGGKVFQITDSSPNEINAPNQRLIGIEKNAVVDIYDSIDLKINDVIILCSAALAANLSKKDLLSAAAKTCAKDIVDEILNEHKKNGNPSDLSIIAVNVYNEEQIESVMRYEGSEPGETEPQLDRESAEVASIRTAKPHSASPTPISNRRKDYIPVAIFGVLILILLTVGIFWISTAGDWIKSIVNPKPTVSITMDALQASLEAIQHTAQNAQMIQFTPAPDEFSAPADPMVNFAIAVLSETPYPYSITDNPFAEPATTETVLPTMDHLNPSSVAMALGSAIETAATTEDTSSAEYSNESIIASLNKTDAVNFVVDEIPTNTPENLYDKITALATPQPKEPIVSEIDGAEMVYVPAGTFIVGSDITKDPYANIYEESPQVEINLDSFWIDKTEVTIEQYKKCISAGGCMQSSLVNTGLLDQYPVTNITWEDAQTYCKWAGKSLPTELQWEKAARGTDERSYPWGPEAPTLENRLANFPGMEDTETNRAVGLMIVGSFPEGESPYGALDMAGNAWEWTSTFYQADYYQTLDEEETPVTNPPEPESGLVRIIRGGSASEAEINNYRAFLRTTNRGYINMLRSYYVGFRCVMGE